MSKTYDVMDFGAVGDGVADDHFAIQTTLKLAASNNGCMYVPGGVYKCGASLRLNNVANRVSVRGDGPNASVLRPVGCDGLNLSFQQSGQLQPYGANIQDIGFSPMGGVGAAGSPIVISYGTPAVSNDHYEPSTIIRNVVANSNDTDWWTNGVDLNGAWNPRLTDVFVSGSPHGGNWGLLEGAGFILRRSCVNAHFVNCSANFWHRGFAYATGTGVNDPNTEGIFFSNCSFVAVYKGVEIYGNPNFVIPGIGSVPRVSGITWNGGLIELRQTGTVGGSAAFDLRHVWDAQIVGMMMLSDKIEGYGCFLSTVKRITVSGCAVQAFNIGLVTDGICDAVLSCGNSYCNTPTQNIFTPDTTGSRSYGHVCDRSPVDIDQGAAITRPRPNLMAFQS